MPSDADNKLVQGHINLFHTLVTGPVKLAAEKASLIKADMVAKNLQGELTGGEQAALTLFMTGLEVLAASTVIASIEVRFSPTHINAVITGVND